MDNTNTDYSVLLAQARALLADESDPIANAANLSAAIFAGVRDINWAGFYFLHNETLVVGPFQGLVACVRIPLGRGVCGSAAEQRTTLIVDDVHEFDGHIACDAASRSEIVVPLMRGDKVFGVLDIDSPLHGRFGAAERATFEALAALYCKASAPYPSGTSGASSAPAAD